MWEAYQYHKKKLELPSGSRAPSNPEHWPFWQDFTKYGDRNEPRETIDSFTVDITKEKRNLGPEDVDTIVIEDSDHQLDSSLSPDDLISDAPLPVPDKPRAAVGKSAAKRSLLGVTAATKNKKAKTRVQVDVSEVFAGIAEVLREEPASAIELNRRGITDMIMASLMEVTDVSALRRIGIQVVEFVEEKVKEFNGQ